MPRRGAGLVMQREPGPPPPPPGQCHVIKSEPPQRALRPERGKVWAPETCSIGLSKHYSLESRCGSEVRTQLVTMRTRVPSLRGLRIPHCHELWRKLQMQLWSGVAAAVGLAGSYSSNSTPSLGTSICHGCGPIKKKKTTLFPPDLIETFLNHITHACASLRREVQGMFSHFLMTSRPDIKDSFVLISDMVRPPETENYFIDMLLSQKDTRFFHLLNTLL